MKTFVAAALALVTVAVAGAAAGGASDAGKTVTCREYGPLRIEAGVWTRKGRKEFFAAVWSPGAKRAGGLAILGRATPATINVDANCRRQSASTSGSKGRLRRPIRYQRTRTGLSYFVLADGQRLAGIPLHQRGFNWWWLAETHYDQGLDVISRRLGHGLRFRCGNVGRVVVHVRRLADGRGSYLSVRPQAQPWLLAEAHLAARGHSWLRVSSRCERDEL